MLLRKNSWLISRRQPESKKNPKKKIADLKLKLRQRQLQVIQMQPIQARLEALKLYQERVVNYAILKNTTLYTTTISNQSSSKYIGLGIALGFIAFMVILLLNVLL